MRSERLGIKCFGNEEVNTAIGDVVALSLGSVNGGSSVHMEAFVVDNNSSIKNVHIEVVKKDFSHLNDIWCSDVCKGEDMLEIIEIVGLECWMDHVI